jgi:hypothetical protein
MVCVYIRQKHRIWLVNCTGNPQVLLDVPGPGPAKNPYPLGGYGFLAGLCSWTPGYTHTRTRIHDPRVFLVMVES